MGRLFQKKINDIYDRWIYELKFRNMIKRSCNAMRCVKENLEHYETVVIGKNIKNIIYTRLIML